MYDQIGLDHYAGLTAFGMPQTEDQIRDLKKALEAGYQVSGQTGGSALRVESLEASLKVLTFSARHLALWRKIPKSPAYSTVEEYNQLIKYGSQDGGFTLEGELPEESSSSYARRTSLVKYLGTTRSVTLPMTMVNPAHGDLIAQENHNGILELLEKTENALFTGDSTLTFGGAEGVQWDGMDRLIDPANVIDAENNQLSEQIIQEASNVIAQNFGFPTDIYAGIKPLGDLVASFYARERVMLPAPMNGQVGNSINTVLTQNGVVQVNQDVFLKEFRNPPATPTSPAKAPVSPGSVTATVSSGAGDGDFEKLQGALDAEYSWAVTACNRYGESAPVYIAATVAMTGANAVAKEHFNLTITNPGAMGGYLPDYFRVYRSRKLPTGSTVSTNVADYSLIMSVPVISQAPSATGASPHDVNFIIPFTSVSYIGEMRPAVLTFRQLAPLMRQDLAVTAQSRRWMILLYGVPILFAPRKWARIINIGTMKAA